MVFVIVPNYNYRRYLKKRLETIVSQTYKDIEIVFLDDGSIDGSMVFADKYLKKSGVKYKIRPHKLT